MEHINLEIIQSYLEGQIKGPGVAEIEAHLAVCERCHSIYMGLKAIEKPISQSFGIEKTSASCPEDWEIGALVREELPSEISEKISNHIRTCGFCMERAAGYYKVLEAGEKALEIPELWKHKTVQALKAERTVKEEAEAPFLQSILAFFQKLTAPLPVSPVYATAALAILILAIWSLTPKHEKIVTIASSEKIITRDSEIPSTFGFMGTGESREIENMAISHDGKNIVFKWKPIEREVEYDFSLRDKLEGKVVYADHIDKNARVSLKKNLMEKDRLYSWLITGKTKNGKYFEYSGDFILME